MTTENEKTWAEDYEKSCKGKVRHNSRKSAGFSIVKLNRHDLRVYHCKFCGKWHTGHPPYKFIKKRQFAWEKIKQQARTEGVIPR